MEHLDKFPEVQRGRPAKYPWEDWLKDGQTTVLRQGTDFVCTRASMRALAKKTAQNAKFNGDVETTVPKGTDSVVIIFHKGE